MARYHASVNVRMSGSVGFSAPEDATNAELKMLAEDAAARALGRGKIGSIEIGSATITANVSGRHLRGRAARPGHRAYLRKRR